MTKLTKWMLTTAFIGLAAIAPVQAQTADAAPSGENVEEITVTAQRREQSLQKVPIAVSAFNATELNRRQIIDTYDILRNIPNMAGNQNVGVGTSASYFLRAVGNGESIATFDVPVGTYVDDVFVARQNANNFALFDVERIEVLRGPQGTLFGRNTTGGAINIVMRKPGEELKGYVEAGYGKFNQTILRASVDLPMSNKVLTKISTFWIRDDGYATQVSTGRKFNSRDTLGIRGMLRLLPTDTLTIDITADHVDDQNTNFLNRVGPNGERLVDNNIRQGAFTGLVTGRKANFSLDNVARSTALTGNIALDLGAAVLTSITGYRKIDQEFIIDSGGFAPRPTRNTGFNPILNDSDHEQVTQELKLNGDVGNLNYVLGAFYMKEDNVTDFAQLATNTTTLVQTVTADRTLLNDTSTWAIYGQGDYRIAERLVLTAGLRYTYEKRTIGVFTNPGALGVQLSTAGIVASGRPIEQVYKAWTPRFAISYEASDDVMLFASATRGFKSGGWPGRATANNAFIPFAPETVWSYEGGLRADAFDNTLRFNATAFYATTFDVQIPAQALVGGVPVSTTTNPADLRNYGLEIETTWIPVQGLNISGSLGLQRARFVNPSDLVIAQQARCRSGSTVAPACNANFVDNIGELARPVRAPAITGNLIVSYDARISGLGTLTPTANYNYTGAYAVATAGSPNQPAASNTYQPSQTYINASLALRPQGVDNLAITVECQNCFNKNYILTNLVGANFFDVPGSWLIRARYNF
ncbi:TonB-dependent receptor [Sandarakinorhabdus limnophila]|uniref:TonB-dependent receptor n=1 Tax=Sandarakinorhabdus limnophila TaxID=210512 RepID=UPI0026EC6D2D|nr:TonB-dependent receptor [Sandarakinorhabdus limnophila]